MGHFILHIRNYHGGKMSRHTITFMPGGEKTNVTEGSTVMEAIISKGRHFDFPCGGRGTCGKCRIRILNGTAEPTPEEKGYLSEDELEQGIRLACHTRILSALTVGLENGKALRYNILISESNDSYEIDPLILKIPVQLPKPSLDESKADFARLKENLKKTDASLKDVKPGLEAIRAMPGILREAGHSGTVVTDRKCVLGIDKGDTSGKIFGVAFDIGTTTIVAYLMDLRTGRELAVAAALNPQVKFGADVISRASFAIKNEDGVEQMQAVLLEEMDRMTGAAAEDGGCNREDIYAVTVVGNTCMHHIFLGITPRYLTAAPYTPVISESFQTGAARLRLNINPAGRVFVLPNIAGFVGADTVSVILATGLDKGRDIRLAVDIGTNGEIVLGSEEKLAACSTAAGPAFEGAQISSGMRGATGAIDHVHFRNGLSYSVIGGGKPKGICGSGLIDVISGLVKLGIVNVRGKLLSPDKFTNPDAFKFEKHIISHEGANAFLLAPESVTEHAYPIMITQSDISAMQLAKGAISAGIRLLMEELDVTMGDIKEVLLAGAFGNYMDPRSACNIGLIPIELADRIKMVGNAAGTGAKRALLSCKEYSRCDDMTKKIKYVELATHRNFNKRFAEGMRFDPYEYKQQQWNQSK